MDLNMLVPIPSYKSLMKPHRLHQLICYPILVLKKALRQVGNLSGDLTNRSIEKLKMIFMVVYQEQILQSKNWFLHLKTCDLNNASDNTTPVIMRVIPVQV